MVSMSAKSKIYPTIPEEEQKCIWMTTGFISYKLCNRGHHCEVCPLDQALRNEENGEDDFQGPEEDGIEELLGGDFSAGINGAIFYHPDHCWVKVENPERVRIGIDDLLTQLITNIKVAILPQVGSFIGRGECYAHIIQEDYILPIVSPLSGSIETINHRLKKGPELITNDPKGDGWLITVRPENLESDLKNLLFGRKALSWYQKEEKEIIDRTALMLKKSHHDVGPTMQDGGVRISCLQDILNIVDSKQKTQILDFSVTKPKKRNRSISLTF
jgi:glycine cleavage system H protein